MADYMKATPGGDPYLDFSDLTPEQTAALVEVTVEDFTEGRGEDARNVRRVKFKLGDKKGALVELGKHLCIFGDKQPPAIDNEPKKTQAELDAIARQELLDYYGAVVDLDAPEEPEKREEPER
jgi:phage terminase small subunit